MTVKEILDASKEKMSKSVAVYQNEMTSLRAGRANPRLLDRIMVDYYGTPTPLPQIGNINVPEARMIVIKPWEKKMISAIEKAIQKSDLGLNPTNDGEVVRLVFPDLNEERRKELTKMARKSAEGAKVAVRSIRRDAVEQIKKLKKDSLITEDEQRKAEDDAQKITDKAIKDIDGICAAKELTKMARKSAEGAKVAVRSIRRDAVEQIKKLKKDSLITEDEQRKAEDDAQKITDKAIKDIDGICAAKEKEIMEV